MFDGAEIEAGALIGRGKRESVVQERSEDQIRKKIRRILIRN